MYQCQLPEVIQHNFNQNSIASSQSTNQSVQIYELGENFKGIIN